MTIQRKTFCGTKTQCASIHAHTWQKWSIYVCEKSCLSGKVLVRVLNSVSDRVGMFCGLAGRKFLTDGAIRRTSAHQKISNSFRIFPDKTSKCAWCLIRAESWRKRGWRWWEGSFRWRIGEVALMWGVIRWRIGCRKGILSRFLFRHGSTILPNTSPTDFTALADPIPMLQTLLTAIDQL